MFAASVSSVPAVCSPEYPYAGTRNPLSKVYLFVKDLFHQIVHQHPLISSSAALALLLAIRKFRYHPLVHKHAAALQVVSLAILLRIGKEWSHLPTALIFQPILSDLGIYADFRKGMNKEVYVPRECWYRGEKIASLSYQLQEKRKIPVLETFTSDPWKRGFAQGVLMGDQLIHLYQHVMRPMKFLLAMQGGDITGHKLAQNTQNMTFPAEFQSEIEGLSVGVQEWSKKSGIKSTLSIEQLRSIHVLADTYKQILFSLGCSTVVLKRGEDLCAFRHLDWVAFQKLGRYMYEAIHSGKDIETGKIWRTRALTFPGFVGMLNGTNGALTLIVNECSRVSHTEGVPYNLFVGKLLRQASSVAEVDVAITKISLLARNLLPASSFHLIAFDSRGEVKNYQFYAKPGHLVVNRTCDKQGVLIVTNHAIDQRFGGIIPGTQSSATSELRYRLIQRALNAHLNTTTPLVDVLKQALKHDPVNGKATIASIIYHGGAISYAFDNCKAGNYWKP